MASGNRFKINKTEENNSTDDETQRVRAYIDELRYRLSKLENEGKEIEENTETVLNNRKNESNISINSKKKKNEEENINDNFMTVKTFFKKTDSEKKTKDENFVSILEKFEQLSTANNSVFQKKDSKELNLLKQVNGNIRNRIEQLQNRIKEARIRTSSHLLMEFSNSTLVEKETCSRLYNAAAATLQKVSEIDDCLNNVVQILIRDDCYSSDCSDSTQLVREIPSNDSFHHLTVPLQNVDSDIIEWKNSAFQSSSAAPSKTASTSKIISNTSICTLTENIVSTMTEDVIPTIAEDVLPTKTDD